MEEQLMHLWALGLAWALGTEPFLGPAGGRFRVVGPKMTKSNQETYYLLFTIVITTTKQ